MLLTSDSYMIQKDTHRLVQVRCYTITFNGFACVLHLDSINGTRYTVGIINSVNDISKHIKTKAEWKQIYPELFI